MAATSVLNQFSINQYAAAIAVLLVLYTILSPVILTISSPLRQVPGPFAARFGKWWKLRKAYRGDFQKLLIKLHAEYGSVVRIAPNEYSIDDVECMKVIYGPGTKFIKSLWYSAGDDPTHPEQYEVFTARDPTFHSSIRRKTASLYAMSSLLQFEPFVNECTALLQTRFDEFATSGQTINMAHWLQCYAFDVIGHITFAKRFGFLDTGEDIGGIMSTIHMFLVYFYHVGMVPGIHPILFRLLQALSPSNSGIAEVGRFAESASQRLAAESASGNKVVGGDFLSRLTELRRNDPVKYTDWDIQVTCRDNVGAGSDTTGISLSATIYNIYHHPKVLSQLRDEIDRLEAVNEISTPITFQDAQKMPYLQAVIKEALRVHPAGGFSLERVVPNEGATICGRFFPKGTIVGVNPWVAHANKAVFGPDADQFRPERWLASKEAVTQMEKYYIPFGSGSRTCLGKNISLMEISKAIPELVRNFDIKIVYGDDNTAYKTLNRCFVTLEDFKCQVRKRSR